MAWPDNEATEPPERAVRIAVIGFGMRGRCIAQALLRGGFDVSAFDRQFAYCHSRPARAVHRLAVREHASIAGAVAHVALVIVAASSNSAVEIARSAADHVEIGCSYLDASGCNPRDAAMVTRALGDNVRITMADRGALLDRSRTMASDMTVNQIVGHLTSGPGAPVYASAQILPFAPVARASQRPLNVRAA